ncbi:MAG TPA: guanylate kinase [Bacteroidia bacterium]|nr:guanylate kinase [Bacteroidia bacterium]
MSEKLILFCGPSGSGKTSIVHYLLNKLTELSFSVSATTRARRPYELNGKDYYFLSIKEFKDKIENHEFLEWEEVYANGFYGTLKSEITRISNEGKAVIFDVDVEGGLNIKKEYRDKLLDVFVMPPGIEELKKRLVARATETDESLKARIHRAEEELIYAEKFSHVIVNHVFEDAAREAENLVKEFLSAKTLNYKL